MRYLIWVPRPAIQVNGRGRAGAERPIDMVLGHGMCNQAEQWIVLLQATFKRLSRNTGVEFLELVRWHEVTMTMNTDSIVESFYILEDEPVGMVIVFNPEAVEPFTLNKWMKGFNAGIIVGIAFVTVTELKPFRGFPVSPWNVLAAAIGIMPNSA